MVKTTTCCKSGDFFRILSAWLCEPIMNIHSTASLWKTLVEKSVENVENSQLSTGISLFTKTSQACGKTAYSCE